MLLKDNDGHTNGNGRAPSWWKSLWGRSRRESQYVAAYRRLALQLHYDLPQESETRCALLLTPVRCRSAAAGLGLALSLGEELRKPVLLIDACPTRPEITETLGCNNAPGWADLLRDPKQNLKDFVLPTSSEHTGFLPAGYIRHGVSSPEALQNRLAEAQRQFDFVLLSGGSVLEDPAGLALLPNAGSVLLLVLENETRVEDLEAAERALALCKARNVRIVLTSPVRGELGFARSAGSSGGA
jgi:hypothetical protein